MLSFYGIKEMGAREWFEQLPLFAAVSICSGLLGALFNALHKALLSVRPCILLQDVKCKRRFLPVLMLTSMSM